jgi:hypothetical protein
VAQRLTHCLFEGAVQPTVVDHILNGHGRIFKVLKGVHEDKVQHYVIEIQVLDLAKK